MDRPKNYLQYNKEAWNNLVRSGNRWTIPVSDEVIDKAKNGEWSVVLTPLIPVPLNWFPAKGSKVLALASGGGQQTPILAAAGFEVTVLDNSIAQLDRDREMAERHHLKITTIEGDMANLSAFADGTFDLIFNPCSTAFVPEVTAVYKESARVLKKGGIFMTGFTKPIYFLFDVRLADEGIFKLKYSQPYSDLTSLDDEELKYFIDRNEPIVFGHTLEQHINGQLKAGLNITEIYEDFMGDNNPVDKYFPALMAVRSVKL
jgi:ubiquinone/menaquinone biosynthesis C-methylase UbiE